MCQGCAQDFSLVKTEGPKIKAESAERGGVLGRGQQAPSPQTRGLEREQFTSPKGQ